MILPELSHEWKTGLSLAWSGYIAVLSVWIVMQKRAPVSTMSWILSLALLPFAGFVIYYFLGPQRLKKQRLKRLRSRAIARAPADCRFAARGRGTRPARLAPDGRAGHGRLRPAGVERDGDPPAVRRRAAPSTPSSKPSRQARDHVHLEYYIFEPDTIGTALRDLLIERAREGVTVRLLLDALGSKRIGRKFMAPMHAAGVQVALFHDTRIGRRLRPVTNYRTHRKIVVCDGRIGFTGGVNITDEEDCRVRPDAYHDVHLRIEGSAVRWLQTTFLEDWAYATGEDPRQMDEAIDRLLPRLPAHESAGDIPVQIVTSGPDSALEAIHRMHVAAIHSAAQRAWLTTPYFVPGEPALMALTSAALRGVDVRLLVPRRSDSLDRERRGAFLLRRAHRGRRQGLGVQGAHAAFQDAGGGRQLRDDRHRELRQSQLPAQLRGVRGDLRSRRSPGRWPHSSKPTFAARRPCAPTGSAASCRSSAMRRHAYFSPLL